MILKKGQKVMVVQKPGRHKTQKTKYGRISEITKHNIVLDYKQYKESFNLSDILSPGEYKLIAWTGLAWEQIKL